MADVSGKAFGNRLALLLSLALACQAGAPCVCSADDADAPSPPISSPVFLAQADPPDAGLSLEDIGFSSSTAQGDAQRQALLDKRSHMLKIHQLLGLAAAPVMLATFVTADGAKAPKREPNGSIGGGTQAGRNLHASLGLATTVIYMAAAYYAIEAPRVDDENARGPIKVHKALAWAHGIGMILTPIMGIYAYSQLSTGHSAGAIGGAHGTAATLTLVSYFGAMVPVVFRF